MKPSLALSHLLMLSTSLLCVAPIAAKQQSDAFSEGDRSEANAMGVEKSTFSSKEREEVILDKATVDAQQNGARRSQGMSSRPGQNAQKGGGKPCATADNPYRIEVKHIEAKGLGYGQGYTSIDGFFTGMVGELVPFLDLRAHVFNSGKWAGNAGVGMRYVINPCSSMFGINAYYDYRDTKHGHFNQVGAGLEGYMDRFEIRINGYLPVGTKRKAYGSEINSLVFNNFEGHYANYTANYNQNVQAAMKGFTSEVGGHIAGDMEHYDLYFGIGPYYFDAKGGKNMWGGKARLKAEVTKYVFLEVSDSYDHVFHNRVQGTVTLSVPFGGKKCYRTGRCQMKKGEMVDNVMDWRAVLPVERQEIIVVSKFKKTRSVDPVAYNPMTGAPYYFVFVNNTNTALNPDGSFENPVANLSNGDGLPSAQSLATANNVIYVFPGNGASTHMEAGMPLSANGLMLLGSGISNTFNTTDGVLVIPPQSSTYPLIAGVAGSTDVVLVGANNCQVSGFMMSPALGGGTGATDKASVRVFTTNVTNLTVTNNVIFNGTWGVSLNDDATTSTSGTIIISDNVISEQQATGTMTEAAGINVINTTNANLLVSNNTVTFGSKTATSMGCDGILIEPGNNTAYQILNNGVEEMSNPGIKVVIPVGTGATTSSGSINGNAINNCLYGVEVINNNVGSSQVSVTNNTVRGSTGTIVAVPAGITDFHFAVVTGSSLCVRLNNNTWSNNVVFDQTGSTGNFIQLEPPINPNGGPIAFTTGSKVFPVPPCFCGVSGTTCFP